MKESLSQNLNLPNNHSLVMDTLVRLDQGDYGAVRETLIMGGLPAKSVAICIRSRNNPEELPLLNSYQGDPNTFDLHEHGVYWLPPLAGSEDNRFTVMVSTNDWSTFTNILLNNNFGDAYVIAPELITMAGLNFDGLIHEIEETLPDELTPMSVVQARIQEVEAISRKYPQAQFILGTVDFNLGDEQDLGYYNCLNVINNGVLTHVLMKRHQAPGESIHFKPAFDLSTMNFTLDTSGDPRIADLGLPFTLAKRTYLICAEIIGASLQNAKISNPTALIERNLTNASRRYLSGSENEVIAIGTWGIGSSEQVMKRWFNEPDESFNADIYYAAILKIQLRNLLKRNKNIKRVIFVDKAALEKGQVDPIKTSIPVNYVAFQPLQNS